MKRFLAIFGFALSTCLSSCSHTADVKDDENSEPTSKEKTAREKSAGPVEPAVDATPTKDEDIVPPPPGMRDPDGMIELLGSSRDF